MVSLKAEVLTVTVKYIVRNRKFLVINVIYFESFKLSYVKCLYFDGAWEGNVPE